MIWQAFYAPWDVIRDRQILSSLCLIFDKVNILGLCWGNNYPDSREDVIEFEKTNYERVRLGNPAQYNALKRWHFGLQTRGGFPISFEELIEIDRSILLEYALDWYPFYNYITPLAEGSDPILINVEPELDPVKYRLVETYEGTKRTSKDHVRYCSIENRKLGIKFEMRKACRKAGGILVYDEPLSYIGNVDECRLIEQLSPLLAMKCLNISFPCGDILDPYEILEARFKLSNELDEFRNKMIDLSLEIAESIEKNPDTEDIKHRLDLKTKKIELLTKNLKSKIKAEKGQLYSKMIAGYGGFISLSSLIASFVTNNWLLSVLGIGAQTYLTIHQENKLIKEIQRESGLAYLIELPKYKKKKANNIFQRIAKYRAR